MYVADSYLLVTVKSTFFFPPQLMIIFQVFIATPNFGTTCVFNSALKTCCKTSYKR